LLSTPVFTFRRSDDFLPGRHFAMLGGKRTERIRFLAGFPGEPGELGNLLLKRPRG
jgi:hypothetical protein